MLLDRFQKYVSEHNICTSQDKILVAVSGGVDSMVLFSLLAKQGYDIGVAHCNFQLRGEEADEDDALVEQQTAKLGVPYYIKRFDTMAEVEASGESVEMAARRLRYEWFNELCAEHGYTHIAIAHHADDSVETFFINMLRGTGLRGLTGIKVINGKLIRPLLFTLRRDIIEFAISNKIPYREDSTNSSPKYLRNKIRLGIVPRIKEISPQFTDTMTANVERLTAAQCFIDRGIELIREEVIRQEGEDIIVDISKIDNRLPLKFVTFELLNRYGFNKDVIDDLSLALEGNHSGRRFYSKDRVAYIDRARIVITPIPTEDCCAASVTAQTKFLCCGGASLRFEHIEIDDIDTLKQPEEVALLDEDKLKYPLIIRRWQEGDSFIPIGMSGRKKISDFLIDKKISLPDKQRQFVLTSIDEIVWIVGRRVDERFRIDSSTENVLKITRSLDTGV